MKVTGGGTLAFGAADGVLTTDNSLTVDAPITGTSGVTAAGTGQVTLSQTNLGLTGTDALNGGTLTLGAVGALGGGALTVTSGTIQASVPGGVTLTNIAPTLNNASLTLAGTNPLLFAGNVALNGSVNVVNVTNTPVVFAPPRLDDWP